MKDFVKKLMLTKILGVTPSSVCERLDIYKSEISSLTKEHSQKTKEYEKISTAISKAIESGSSFLEPSRLKVESEYKEYFTNYLTAVSKLRSKIERSKTTLELLEDIKSIPEIQLKATDIEVNSHKAGILSVPEDEDNRKNIFSDVIVWNDNFQILLLKRKSTSSFEPFKWCLPGGHVDKGDNHLQTAQKELSEETGVVVEEDQLKLIFEYRKDDTEINYYSVTFDQVPTITLLECEHNNYQWVDIDDLEEIDLICNLRDNLKLIYPDLQKKETYLSQDDYNELVVTISRAVQNKVLEGDSLKAVKERLSSFKPLLITNDDGDSETVYKLEEPKKKNSSVSIEKSIKEPKVAEKTEKPKDKFDFVMKEFEQGKLHSGDGSIVKDKDQAIAIAYSESGLEKSEITDSKIEEIDIEKAKVVPVGTENKYNEVKQDKGWEYKKKTSDKGPKVSQTIPLILQKDQTEVSILNQTRQVSDLVKDDSGIVKYVVYNSKTNPGVAYLYYPISKKWYLDSKELGHNPLSTRKDLYPKRIALDKIQYKIVEEILQLQNEESVVDVKVEGNKVTTYKLQEEGIIKPLSTYQIKEDGSLELIKGEESDLLSDSDFIDISDIEKGKRAQLGEKRTWGGREMEKTAGGWVPVDPSKKPSKEDETKTETSGEISNIEDFAKKTPTEKLQNFVDTSDDEELKKVAQQELSSREKGDTTSSTENKENPHLDKFRALSDEQVKFYLDAPYPEVKEAAKMIAEERGLNIVSKGDYIKQFEDWSEKDNKEEVLPFYDKDAEKSKEYLSRNHDTHVSVESYKEDGFKNIRDFISNPSEFKDTPLIEERLKSDIKNISNFIDENKIKDSLTLHRMVLIGRTFFPKLKEGDIYEDKSFSSTSLKKITAFGDFHIKILAKKGSRVANLNNRGEKEYLIDKDSKFRVIEKHKDGLGITVELL